MLKDFLYPSELLLIVHHLACIAFTVVTASQTSLVGYKTAAACALEYGSAVLALDKLYPESRPINVLLQVIMTISNGVACSLACMMMPQAVAQERDVATNTFLCVGMVVLVLFRQKEAFTRSPSDAKKSK